MGGMGGNGRAHLRDRVFVVNIYRSSSDVSMRGNWRLFEHSIETCIALKGHLCLTDQVKFRFPLGKIKTFRARPARNC